MPPTVTIIIPTLGRGACLRDCLESLHDQSYQDYDIVKVTEEGPLAKLRNQGAKRARGKYIVFIDDDVYCSPRWLQSIVETFEKDENIGGVSGPAVITGEFKRNRDIFRFGPIKLFYDLFFCGGRQSLPGHICKSGAWTTGAHLESCAYDGPVHFLEACNMAYRADVFTELGGFDESYLGVGDWSEPDLAFRVRQAGYNLWFSRDARLEHRPSCSGAFKKRKYDSGNRLANYEQFSRRWIKPCWQHTLYKKFIGTYYALKTIE